MPLGDQMRHDFFGARGVACAFAVYTVEDIGHSVAGRVYRGGMTYGCALQDVGSGALYRIVAGSSRSLM